jgi:hypothetical protein
MGSQSATAPAAGVDEVQAYIQDMVRQLAFMAADVGDERTATALREIVATHLPQSMEHSSARRR